MPLKVASADDLQEFPFAEKTIKIFGKEYTFRELSVEENDDCADMARDKDGKINGRTMMRLMIISSSVTPKLTVESLAKMPQRVYLKVYDTVNELNNMTLDDDEEAEGNG